MTPVLVCESVRAETTAQLVTARDACRVADLVELRLDGMASPDVAQALAGRRTPVVVTCRAGWEGGAWTGDETTREQLLETALRAGAEFVDVEWLAPWRRAFVERWRERVVLSWHDFGGVPADLVARVREMARAGAAVVKVAVAVRRLRDLDVLLSLRRELPPDQRLVIIGMGESGVLSRLVPQRFGSAWTYAGEGIAPGQVPADRLVHEFRVRALGPRTMVFGVVGNPISHSVSPAMHNAALAASGIDAVYVPFAAHEFEDFTWAAAAFDVAGVSVTAPFKDEAFQAAARADAVATALRTANTLRREADGQWAARNTDADGFLAPVSAVSLPGQRAAVLGAGGAAKAVVAALRSRGVACTVYARRTEVAAALAAHLEVESGEWPPAPGSWDLLVNTTPVGTWPDRDASPLEASIVHGPLVYDLVYNPPMTALLRAATANGCQVISGLEMLIHQAARQFEWWTGQPAPVEAMREAAATGLEAFRRHVVR
jgi:3-dehydroquinate dehydratase/shikimate dehydrogenase